jgi:hypothetical protein
MSTVPQFAVHVVLPHCDGEGYAEKFGSGCTIEREPAYMTKDHADELCVYIKQAAPGSVTTIIEKKPRYEW